MIMKVKYFALMLVALALTTACEKTANDEPEIFNNTTWYPVRTVGEYQIWQRDKISYDLPVGADGTAILYYELDGKQEKRPFIFPTYEFFMENGKNVFNAIYPTSPELSDYGPWEYYVDGDYIFLSEPNFSSSSSAATMNFSPKPLTIFTSDSIKIGDAFYKKR